jgi:hypothetical protein
MTEAEWLAATEPSVVPAALHGRASDRKLRLLNVACGRRIWASLPPDSRNFVEVLEQYADGLVPAQVYLLHWTHAINVAAAADHDPPDTSTYATASVGISNPPTVASVFSCLSTAATAMASGFAECAPEGEYDSTFTRVREMEASWQSQLIRDIFGNPFRPVAADPTWLTSTVTALARQMYEARDFAAMPILADALQDAGCVHEDILGHCRGDGPHVRGCWVVDLLLGLS